ncbi:MAG: hypothetical protein WAO07_20795 [Desulfobacterales bacterium]
MTNALIFFIIGLIYALLKVFLEKRLAPMDSRGEEYDLSDLAFSTGRSVYDVFKAAAVTWNVAVEKSEDDFKKYLTQGHIPHYVRDYLRRQIKPGDRTHQKLIFSGGRPPYL